MHNYISPDGIRGLDAYKYVGGAYSVLDNILNPFWAGIAERLPMTLAPNLITLIGACRKKRGVDSPRAHARNNKAPFFSPRLAC